MFASRLLFGETPTLASCCPPAALLPSCPPPKTSSLGLWLHSACCTCILSLEVICGCLPARLPPSPCWQSPAFACPVPRCYCNSVVTVSLSAWSGGAAWTCFYSLPILAYRNLLPAPSPGPPPCQLAEQKKNHLSFADKALGCHSQSKASQSSGIGTGWGAVNGGLSPQW